MEIEVDAKMGVELATKNDILGSLNKLLPYRERYEIGQDGQTDSNGNVNIPVYRVKPGKTFFLYKLIIWVAGYDAGNTPSLGTHPWAGIFHGLQFAAANLADFGPNNGGAFILPCTFEYNSHTAPMFSEGDVVGVGLFHTIASTNIMVRGWGELQDDKYVRNY